MPAKKPDPKPPVDDSLRPWGKIGIDENGNEVPIIKKRKGFVLDEAFSLDPQSLTGSVFHVVVDHEIVWQGVVVGEPQAGRYLCEIDRLEEGALNVQRLFTVDTMLGLGDDARRLLENAVGELSAPVMNPTLEFRFFDSIEAANQAFVDWTVQTKREEV